MADSSQKESLGIVVSYRVKVKLILGFGSGDLSVELPFTMTHPKPLESPPTSRPASLVPTEPGDVPVDTNLIQLDTNGEAYYGEGNDEDFIFEDFARLRLKGHEGDDTEA